MGILFLVTRSNEVNFASMSPLQTSNGLSGSAKSDFVTMDAKSQGNTLFELFYLQIKVVNLLVLTLKSKLDDFEVVITQCNQGSQ